MITGSLVAIVSPMHEDGSLDFDALRRLIEWHIAEAVSYTHLTLPTIYSV